MDSSGSDSSSSDEEDLALLVLLSRSGSQCRSDRFNLEQPAFAAVWKSKCRFEKDDIIALVMHFQLPDPFPTPQRYQVSALEALCIFLRRMAYPARLEGVEDLFGRDPTAISSISNAVLDFLYKSFSHLLLCDTRRLTNATLSAYASGIYDKGAPLRREVTQSANRRRHAFPSAVHVDKTPFTRLATRSHAASVSPCPAAQGVSFTISFRRRMSLEGRKRKAFFRFALLRYSPQSPHDPSHERRLASLFQTDHSQLFVVI
ncbi:hypothetical protein JG688_00011004 [Phytophthora aleatoria]|uniref:Uncharacterized protein n=1 Tax=Phytophthora aleatoria TaxID=2496075 RepID=A0A8J5IPI9_9STRA|nr:hypothetical protein JG688_00011004 [Phytophthora aleatoria]